MGPVELLPVHLNMNGQGIGQGPGPGFLSPPAGADYLRQFGPVHRQGGTPFGMPFGHQGFRGMQMPQGVPMPRSRPGPMGPPFGVGFGMGMNMGGAPFHNGHGNAQLKRRADQSNSLLAQLRKDNAKKTRTHFAGHELGTPRAPVPAAPDNRHGFLLSAQGSVPPACTSAQGLLHAVTPSAVPDSEGTGGFWRNSYGTADKEAVQAAADAGLDFLGSFYDDGGSGLDIGDDDSLERSGSDPEANAELPAKANEQPPEAFDDEGAFPPAAKRKIASQQAYIAQLEEQALTLKERIFLLEQQLKERDAQDLQAPPSPSASGHSGDTDGAASPTSSSS